jgi:hypothetical protein
MRGSTALGQLSGRSALLLRNLFETIFLSQNQTPGSRWPHPYANAGFWNGAFSRSKARQGKTHDWMFEYPEIRRWRSVIVGRFTVHHSSLSPSLSPSPSSSTSFRTNLLMPWFKWMTRRSEHCSLVDTVRRTLDQRAGGAAAISDADEAVKSATRMLITGCGSSPLAEDLWEDGWRGTGGGGGSITSIDFSEEAIVAAHARAQSRFTKIDAVSKRSPSPDGEPRIPDDLQYEVADATVLRVMSGAGTGGDGGNVDENGTQWQPTEPFHVILDKGLFDALLLAPADDADCADFERQQPDRLSRLSCAMHQVLRPGGQWLIYSLSGPDVVKCALSFHPQAQQHQHPTRRSANATTTERSDHERCWVVDVHRLSKAYLYVASRE